MRKRAPCLSTRRRKMIIRNKKPFSVGLLFAVSFLGVLFLIFSPIFGGKTGLQYADDSFNKLSKGSSYFIPKVSRSVEKFEGKYFEADIRVEKKEEIAPLSKVLTLAGATVEPQAQGDMVKISGDLGSVLKSALADSDAMYRNDGHAVAEKYGLDEKAVMKIWWTALGKIEKVMKKAKDVKDAKVVSDVNKKAIEPAYNYYKIEAQDVKKHAGMMSGLLVFYVAYTMWWGYAIFYLFEGIGLTMKKAKVKKEA